MRPIDALVRALLPELCWGQMEPAYKILQKMNVDELNALMTEIQEFKVLLKLSATYHWYKRSLIASAVPGLPGCVARGVLVLYGVDLRV